MGSSMPARARARAPSACRSSRRPPSRPSAGGPAGGPTGSGAWLGLPAATCHRALRRQGLVGQPKEPTPVIRYEHERPGDLVHLDTKKLGRIVGGPGHRATGDRTRRARGVGWELLHVAIDDASRLVYAEILPDETGDTAAAFTERAVAWFAAEGVVVRRILTDIQAWWALALPWSAGCVRMRRSGSRPPSLSDRSERSSTPGLLITLAGGATAGGRIALLGTW